LSIFLMSRLPLRPKGEFGISKSRCRTVALFALLPRPADPHLNPFHRQRIVTTKKKDIPLPRLAAGQSPTDTHCHLDMYGPDAKPGQIIAEAGEVGVHTIITVGIDLASSRQAVRLAESHAQVYATVGVHPHNVADVDDEVYAELEKLAAHPKVVAYGEIGLDYVKKYVPVPKQLAECRRQVRLAKRLALPLVIHDREAHGDILEILREEGPFPAGGVMHCFSGDRHFADRVMELGLHISIPGVVTFANAKELREAVHHIPLASLLVETDGPFLAPVPRRGKTNFPLLLLYTAQKIAELKGVTLEEVAGVTTDNAKRLFGLGGK
jgi:TatD DNase family protein